MRERCLRHCSLLGRMYADRTARGHVPASSTEPAQSALRRCIRGRGCPCSSLTGRYGAAARSNTSFDMLAGYAAACLALRPVPLLELGCLHTQPLVISESEDRVTVQVIER